jgi:hypothetical protein
MVWTSNISGGDLRTGPFQIGVGAAGSEQGVGECDEIQVFRGYDIVEKVGGAFLGRTSLIDAIVQGIRAGGTFMGMQMDETTLDRLFPLATLSTGNSSKSMTLTNTTIVGKSLLAQASRIRFHYEGQSTLTDETKDIIFPKGIIVPTDEPYTIDGSEDNMKQPFAVLAFWDVTTGTAHISGQNVTC